MHAGRQAPTCYHLESSTRACLFTDAFYALAILKHHVIAPCHSSQTLLSLSLAAAAAAAAYCCYSINSSLKSLNLHLHCLTTQKRGSKALVLDPGISGPLSLLDISLPDLLAEHGVSK